VEGLISGEGLFRCVGTEFEVMGLEFVEFIIIEASAFDVVPSP
jgi:hypothetical protein